MEKINTLVLQEEKRKLASKRLFSCRLIYTSLFMCFALTLYMMNVINFPGVLLILFGALWNFFVDINTFMAFILSLLVGVIFSSFAIIDGLYINAILYLLYYIPLQFGVFLIYMNEKDMSIKRNKKLNGQKIYYITMLFIVVFGFCFALALLFDHQILPVFDAASACLLGLSAYLQSTMYREYYIIRPIALIASIGLWVYVCQINGLTGGAVSIILLYMLYFLLDLLSLYFWWDASNLPQDRELASNEDMISKKISQYQSIDTANKKEPSGGGEDSLIS